jgi:hypothetical protein
MIKLDCYWTLETSNNITQNPWNTTTAPTTTAPTTTIADALKNDVRMISGCEDHKTSADVSNVGSYQLPNPAGRAGGACTATLLKVLYENEERPNETFTFVEVLTAVRKDLKQKGLAQIPQLTSSNPIDMNVPFELVPETATGTRRAVLM